MKLSRQTLWEWTFTFESEKGSLEFVDWLKGIRDLLASLNAKTREQLGEITNETLSSILGDTYSPSKPNEKNGEDVDVGGIVSAVKLGEAMMPMDIAAARLGNLVTQPDFLINWQEHDKPAIKKAFAEWLDRVEPKKIKPHVENSEARADSLLKDLKSLGVMRLLHVYTSTDLIRLYRV